MLQSVATRVSTPVPSHLMLLISVLEHCISISPLVAIKFESCESEKVTIVLKIKLAEIISEKDEFETVTVPEFVVKVLQTIFANDVSEIATALSMRR
jgi:hypothetical protein